MSVWAYLDRAEAVGLEQHQVVFVDQTKKSIASFCREVLGQRGTTCTEFSHRTE